MGKRPDFDDVITSFYEAATDAVLWRSALARMTELFEPSFAANLFIWDRLKKVVFADVDRDELAAANADYASYYNSIYPRAGMVARMPAGFAMACHHYFDDAYVAKSEFYQDFMIKIGGRYIAGAKLTETARYSAIIAAHRNIRQGPFEERDVVLLKRLLPHLSQAASLFHKFTDFQGAQERATAALDRFPEAIFVVGQNAQILERNAAAEVLIRQGNPLRARNGRVEATDSDRTGALHKLIADAHAAAGGKVTPPGGVLRLDRLSAGSHLTILVAPLRQATRNLTSATSTGVLLFVADSETQPIMPAKWLNQLYGLTPAEAEVALAIASGKTLEEIAGTNGVTKNTVRVQTQSILSKTGVRRQAELVALLARIPTVR